MERIQVSGEEKVTFSDDGYHIIRNVRWSFWWQRVLWRASICSRLMMKWIKKKKFNLPQARFEALIQKRYELNVVLLKDCLLRVEMLSSSQHVHKLEWWS